MLSLKKGEMVIANPFDFEVIKIKDYNTEKLHHLHAVLTDYDCEKKWADTINEAKNTIDKDK